MRLVSDELVEFRRRNESEGQNGKNYYYYFEDENMPFQLFSKKELDLVKGCMYTLVFSTRLWDNKLQFNLEDVIPNEGK